MLCQLFSMYEMVLFPSACACTDTKIIASMIARMIAGNIIIGFIGRPSCLM
jgi:hypothetical protein